MFAVVQAARTGYAAAARAAVRKLRKRIGHVISVSTVELDNTENPMYKAALDAALLKVEDVDPCIDLAMQALKANVGDAATVDALLLAGADLARKHGIERDDG